MREKNLILFSTLITAFIFAVFMTGSINQSIATPEKSITNEPTIVSTSPSDEDEDVTRNIVIEITFSEEMDSTSMKNSTFTLMQGTESVAGKLEYSGNKAMFTTQKSLKAHSKYTANISTANNQSDVEHSENEFNDEEHEETHDVNNGHEESHNVNNGNEWSFTTGGNSDPVETVDLGSAAEFVILAQSSIHNDSTSEITGEKGFDRDSKSSKENETAYWLNNEDVDEEAVQRDTTRDKSSNRDYSASERGLNADNLDEAFEDMKTAYTNAEERSQVDFINYKFIQSDDQTESTPNYNRVDDKEMKSTDSKGLELGEDYNAEPAMDKNRNESSVTLEPGVYKWNDSVEISTNITLSGNAEDVWIFQIPEGLTVSRDVEIILSDGAVAEHVFWQVAGEVSLGESSHFEGIILSQSGITMKSKATLNGRMLAQTDVTLDENTIIEPHSARSTNDYE